MPERDRICEPCRKLRNGERERHLEIVWSTAQNPPMQISPRIRSAVLALAVVLPACLSAQGSASIARPGAPADLILVNGRVYTVDDSRPMVSAFAVKNG